MNKEIIYLNGKCIVEDENRKKRVEDYTDKTEEIGDFSNFDLFEEKIPYPKLKIRNMKTRWGVCNIKDNSVTLNSKLIEYVSSN